MGPAGIQEGQVPWSQNYRQLQADNVGAGNRTPALCRKQSWLSTAETSLSCPLQVLYAIFKSQKPEQMCSFVTFPSGSLSAVTSQNEEGPKRMLPVTKWFPGLLISFLPRACQQCQSVGS